MTSRAPSISILGAFFPAWMLCIVAGIVLTLLLRAVLRGTKLEDYVGPRALVYPAALVLFTLSTWIVYFQR